MSRLAALRWAIVFVVSGSLMAQSVIRVVVSVPALVAYSGFYHLKPILVRGELATRGDRLVLLPPSGDRGVELYATGSRPDDGPAEVRGTFWDVGRMTADDPRFADLDIQAFLDRRTGGRWPGQGELLVIRATEITRAAPPPAPTLRAIVLEPERYVGQRVTITGTFRARNLLGDLPKAPPQGTKWDFVLQSAGASLWVTGLRPKGKGFDLDPSTRMDTGRLLEVSGTVRISDELVRIEAVEISAPAVTAVQPTEERVDLAEVAPAVPLPIPEVTFSLPTEGETDVDPAAPVKIQVSRNLDAATFEGRVRVTYVSSPGVTPPAIDFTVEFSAADRVLQIRFAKPLMPFRTVTVELLEGILGTDKQPLKPFKLSFTTGGSHRLRPPWLRASTEAGARSHGAAPGQTARSRRAAAAR